MVKRYSHGKAKVQKWPKEERKKVLIVKSTFLRIMSLIAGTGPGWLSAKCWVGKQDWARAEWWSVLSPKALRWEAGHFMSATALPACQQCWAAGLNTRQLPHAELQDPALSTAGELGAVLENIRKYPDNNSNSTSFPLCPVLLPQIFPVWGRKKSHFGRKSGAPRSSVIKKNWDRVFQEQFHGD